MSVKFDEAFCFDSFQDRLLWFDDFHGDQLQDEWRMNTTGTIVVVDQQTGGVTRSTTGVLVNNESSIDWNNIRSLHVDQRVSMETRLKMNQITYVRSNIGLFFDFSNLLDFRVSEAAGGGASWYIRAIDGGVPTSQNSGVVLDTNYHIFRIESHTHGGNHAHYYIDGTQTANSPITTNIPDDATDYLQPFLLVKTLEALAKSMDIDYVYLRQERQ